MNSRSFFVVLLLSAILVGGIALVPTAQSVPGMFDARIFSKWYYPEYETGDPTAKGWVWIDLDPGSPYYEDLDNGTIWTFQNLVSYSTGSYESHLWTTVTGRDVVTPDLEDESIVQTGISSTHYHYWMTIHGEEE